MEVVDLEKLFDAKLEAVHQEFASVNQSLTQILEQTTKTNGRVTTLEVWKNQNIHLPKIVYGLVGLILVAFGGAIINLVM